MSDRKDYYKMSHLERKREFGILVDQLKELGAETVVVQYDGYADSGSFEDVEVMPKEVELPLELQNELQDLMDAVLSDRHPGWEINEGANGNFTITVKTGELSHEHNLRYEDYETTETHGW